LKTKKDRRIDIKRLNGASIDVIKAWFRRLAIPIIKAIDPQDRWNIDETRIIEGIGINGLCVGSSKTKEALSKHHKARI
jgi:4-hydroxybenzoate polyprenyltransferase